MFVEFKMEREDLVTVGQEVPISEGKLPYSYYYVVEPAIAMSGNYPTNQRIMARKGIVREIENKPTGFYLKVELEDNKEADNE